MDQSGVQRQLVVGLGSRRLTAADEKRRPFRKGRTARHAGPSNHGSATAVVPPLDPSLALKEIRVCDGGVGRRVHEPPHYGQGAWIVPAAAVGRLL